MSNTDFNWSSTNPDIASVNSSGLVTGLKNGYTTIVAKHKTSDYYVMAIVNVAENFANPQVETGEGFTVSLKSDRNSMGMGQEWKWRTRRPVQMRIN